jgi:hypothetical protein
MGIKQVVRDFCYRGGERYQKGMDMGPLRSLAITAFALSGITSAAALTIDPAQHTIAGIRNARYCEIIPVARSGFHLVATVYNTLGLNDCPPALWDKITEAEMKKRFGAIRVLLNGPRHFVMDKIVAGGDTAAGETIEAGGLKLTERASIDLSIFGMRTEPYQERTIDRDTRYVFEAGKPVFLLVAPDGKRYAMQAYAQMIDKSLSYDDLPGLGARLKLPSGWRYEVMVPKSDLVLGANGQAIIVQDNLDDTYQKID